MAWLRRLDTEMLDVVDGVTPLILTAAHAGTEGIVGMTAVRTDPGIGGTFNGGPGDAYTGQMTEAAVEVLDWMGYRPFVVLPLVQRRHLDLNRAWPDHNRDALAAGGATTRDLARAEAVYNAYFTRLEAAAARIRGQFAVADSARALLIDVHGIDMALEVEIGTRDGTTADAQIVYGDGTGPLTFLECLIRQGFTTNPSAGPVDEAIPGVEVLSRMGLRGRGGVHAIQLEFSRLIRGYGNPTPDTAYTSGRRLGMAIGQLLRARGYPAGAPDQLLSQDDELYAALAH